MIYLLYTVHILVCLFLVLVVLLQQGKGADLSVFGGGATQAAFGSRGAASLLHKLTVWSFVAFIFTTVSISFATSNAGRSSVMSDVPEQAAPAEAAPADTAAAETPPAQSAGSESTAAQPADSAPTEEESTGGAAGDGGTGSAESSGTGEATGTDG
ncbi:MAG: preprotein translocase subunit SecG [Thermoanaerobaculia bacterium]|nr:preprotein translocase subunit SecG [Thermoanaerobaculia bacterium]